MIMNSKITNPHANTPDLNAILKLFARNDKPVRKNPTTSDLDSTPAAIESKLRDDLLRWCVLTRSILHHIEKILNDQKASHYQTYKSLTMAKKNPSTEPESLILNIPPLQTGIAEFHILGTRPLIQNRMAEKAKLELLIPRGSRLTQAD